MTDPSGSELAAESEFEVIERPDLGRFELLRDGEVVGFAVYQLQDGDLPNSTVVVPHVETLLKHRGQGYADRLMAGLLDILALDGRAIVPLCSFAAGYVRDNPRPDVSGAA